MKHIDKAAPGEQSRNETITEILHIFSQLNERGKALFTDYLSELHETQKGEGAKQ